MPGIMFLYLVLKEERVLVVGLAQRGFGEWSRVLSGQKRMPVNMRLRWKYQWVDFNNFVDLIFPHFTGEKAKGS